MLCNLLGFVLGEVLRRYIISLSIYIYLFISIFIYLYLWRETSLKFAIRGESFMLCNLLGFVLGEVLRRYTHTHTHTHIYIYIYTYIYIYIYLYLCIYKYMHICIYIRAAGRGIHAGQSAWIRNGRSAAQVRVVSP